MNYFLNFVFIIAALFIFGVLVRYCIRSYYAEKRRHIAIMMQGTSDDIDTVLNEEKIEDDSVVCNEKSKKEKYSG
jgi:hypothetical protein